MITQPHHLSAAYGKPPFFDFALIMIALACFMGNMGI